MADDSNTPLFGQPAVSPETLRGRRAVNQALLQQGLDTSPIRSPWQGAARLAETLVGALGQGRLDKAELEARQKLTQDTIDFWNGGDPSRLLANPYTTPEALRLAIEGRKLRQTDMGTGTAQTNQFTGQQGGPIIPHNIVTHESVGPNGEVQAPTVVQGAPYNAPYRPPAPPPQAGAPMTPRPVQTVPGNQYNLPPNQWPQGAAPNASFGQRFGFDAAAPTNSLDALFTKGQQFRDVAEQNKMALAERAADFQRGMSAQQKRQAYAVLNDAYSSGGDAISGGPAGAKILEGKQLLNQFLGFDPAGLPQTEVIKKTSGRLAQEAAAGLRGTNMEFGAALQRTPGIELSNAGSKYLLHIANQENDRDERFSIEGQNVAPQNYAQFKKDWFARNQIVSPFTGKPLNGKTSEEDMAKLRAATGYRAPLQVPGANANGWSIRPRGQ